MTRPRFSVIVPAKDAGGFLADALTSLTRQVDDPAELHVVVVDDGSQDDTAQVARSFGSRLPGLELIQNMSAVGLASARNQGLAAAVAARSDWIAYLDADDWMAPGRLPAMAYVAGDRGCAWVRTDHTTVAGRDRQLVRACEPRRDVPLEPNSSILPPDVATMVDYPYAWAGLFDAAMAQDGLLSFDDGLHTAEDRPWIWNLHLNGPTYAVVDAPTLCYRRGVSTSLTQVFDRRQLDFFRAFESVGAILSAHPKNTEFLPKYVRTVLAITAHHVLRVRRAVHDPDLTSDAARMLEPDLVAMSARMLSGLPEDLMADQLPYFSGERAEALVDLLPAALAQFATTEGVSR